MRLLVCLLAAAACAATPNAPFYSVKAGALFNATTSDAAGNVYIAGGATSRRFPATPRAYQTKDDKGVCFRNTCSDAFVMKLDPMGNVVFATQLAGSGADSAGAIALDSAGNIYVTGQTGHIVGQVNDFPITKNALFPHTGPGMLSHPEQTFLLMDSSPSSIPMAPNCSPPLICPACPTWRLRWTLTTISTSRGSPPILRPKPLRPLPAPSKPDLHTGCC